jgi:aspartokinase-like uncharacterized kinase
MIVVKVGGSLYDWPPLGERLSEFLESFQAEVCIIPGGGAAAEAVRRWDEIHLLGEEESHRLAIQAMTLSGRYLAALLAGRASGGFGKDLAQPSFARPANKVEILEVETWMRCHDTLPHSWDVTSDSIAAHVAIEMKASKLILLKSTDMIYDSWRDAADHEFVDHYFPTIANRIQCPIEIVNLRGAALRFAKPSRRG